MRKCVREMLEYLELKQQGLTYITKGLPSGGMCCDIRGTVQIDILNLKDQNGY